MLWRYDEDASVLIRLLEWCIKDKELDISDVADDSVNMMSEMKTFDRCKCFVLMWNVLFQSKIINVVLLKLCCCHSVIEKFTE